MELDLARIDARGKQDGARERRAREQLEVAEVRRLALEHSHGIERQPHTVGAVDLEPVLTARESRDRERAVSRAPVLRRLRQLEHQIALPLPVAPEPALLVVALRPAVVLLMTPQQTPGVQLDLGALRSASEPHAAAQRTFGAEAHDAAPRVRRVVHDLAFGERVARRRDAVDVALGIGFAQELAVRTLAERVRGLAPRARAASVRAPVQREGVARHRLGRARVEHDERGHHGPLQHETHVGGADGVLGAMRLLELGETRRRHLEAMRNLVLERHQETTARVRSRTRASSTARRPSPHARVRDRRAVAVHDHAGDRRRRRQRDLPRTNGLARFHAQRFELREQVAVREHLQRIGARRNVPHHVLAALVGSCGARAPAGKIAREAHLGIRDRRRRRVHDSAGDRARAREPELAEIVVARHETRLVAPARWPEVAPGEVEVRSRPHRQRDPIRRRNGRLDLERSVLARRRVELAALVAGAPRPIDAAQLDRRAGYGSPGLVDDAAEHTRARRTLLRRPALLCMERRAEQREDTEENAECGEETRPAPEARDGVARVRLHDRSPGGRRATTHEPATSRRFPKGKGVRTLDRADASSPIESGAQNVVAYTSRSQFGNSG
jgi:hypothetical protein